MLGMFEYRVPHVWTNQFFLVKTITAWVNLGAAEDPLDIDDLYNMWLNLEWNETGFYGFWWIFMDFDGFCVSSTMTCTRPGCWFQTWSCSNQRMRSWWIKIVRHPFKVLKPYNLEMIWNDVQDHNFGCPVFGHIHIWWPTFLCSVIAQSRPNLGLAADRHWTLQSESHPLAPNGARSGSAG